MGFIFISYRRDDVEYFASRFYTRLAERYGKNKIFMDLDSLSPGKDFRRDLQDALSKTDVLLALIGKRWMDNLRRRMDANDDYVRLEIASALQREIPVIPLVMKGADMPKEEDLPSDLKGLAFRHNMEIRFDRDFDRDIDRLVRALEKDELASPYHWWSSWRKGTAKTKRSQEGGPSPKEAGADPRASDGGGHDPTAQRTSPHKARGEDQSDPFSRGTAESKRAADSAALERDIVERIRKIKESSDEFQKLGQPAGASQRYVKVGAVTKGPFTEEQLRLMRRRGEFSPLHQVSCDRIHWVSAAELIRMFDGLQPARQEYRQSSGSAPIRGQPGPGAAEPARSKAPEWYYLDRLRQRVGPVSEQTLGELLRTRRLPRTTIAFKEGGSAWDPVTRYAELAPNIPSGLGWGLIIVLTILALCSFPLLLFVLGWIFRRA